MVVVGGIAWLSMLVFGLYDTANVGNAMSWGLLIAVFAFLVGFGAGSQFLAALIVLLEKDHLLPWATLAQAIALAENDYGDKTYWYEDLAGAHFDKDGNIVPGSSEALKWFNKYLAPYMKIMKTEELSDGTFMVYFPDGSALQQVYSSSSRD